MIELTGKETIKELTPFQKEIIFSEKIIENTALLQQRKICEEIVPPIEKEALAAFQEYSDFITPHLSKVGTAILLWDNQLTDTKITKIPGLNREMVVTHTRHYYLPDTLETVHWQSNYFEKFINEEPSPEGFEEYRKRFPGYFNKAILRGAYNPEARSYRIGYQVRFNKETALKIAKLLENQIPETSDVDRKELSLRKEKLGQNLKIAEDKILQVEIEASKLVKHRIKQLLETLQGKKKINKNTVIPIMSTAETDINDRDILYYLMLDTLDVVTAPEIPKKKKSLKRNLEIIDSSQKNNTVLLWDSGIISKKIIQTIFFL